MTLIEFTNQVTEVLRCFLVSSQISVYETRGHSGLHSAFQVMDVLEIAICYFTETHTRL